MSPDASAPAPPSPRVGGRCVLLTGLPRGGTTIACELLNRLPDVCALDEPMDVIATLRAAAELGDGAAFVHAEIERFAERQRRSILERGVACTKHVDGHVAGQKVSDRRDEQGRRIRLAQLGEVPVARPAMAGFTLVLKHPVAFTALLPILLERFEVFAIVRNPLAVLGSWESVPMAVRDGRLGLPDSVAPELAARLETIEDRLERQLALLDWFYASYAAAMPATAVIRYEDVIASGGAALSPVAAGAAQLRVALESRNAARVYDREHMRRAGRLLLARGGEHMRFYDESELKQVLLTAGATEPISAPPHARPPEGAEAHV